MHEVGNPNLYSPVRAAKAPTQPERINRHPQHQAAYSIAYSG